MTDTERKDTRREGNTATLIYDRLRADILSGKLQPGIPLSQLKIARENGTSRGPVREAMRRLQQDQLVTAFANRRFNVAEFAIADLEAVLGLHLANMALAIRAAVPLLTEAEVTRLQHYSEALEATADSEKEAWEDAYREFALTIVRPCGERTIALVAGLIDNIQRYRSNLLDNFPRVYAGGPEFRRIVAAARRRDGVMASAHYVKFFGRISAQIIAEAAPSFKATRLQSYRSALSSTDPIVH